MVQPYMTSGERYNRLVSVRRDESRGDGDRWVFKCDCGAEHSALAKRVRSGNTKSCGCLRRNTPLRKGTFHPTHGLSRTAEYKIWGGMVNRCYNEADETYQAYGARGITVCDEWRWDFPAFLAYIGPRPSPKHSIDRIDNDGNYEPGNVRWATSREQALNRSNSITVNLLGREMPLADAAIAAGVPYVTMYWRYKNGKPLIRSLLA